MRTLQVGLERRCAAPPDVVWARVADPYISARFQTRGLVTESAGTPGTVGFTYVLSSRRGGRRDTVHVAESEAPWMLREVVSSDLLARSAPGEVTHPSEQRTTLAPDGDGTLVRWELSTPAPWYARPYVRWSTRRAVSRILRGICAEAVG